LLTSQFGLPTSDWSVSSSIRLRITKCYEGLYTLLISMGGSKKLYWLTEFSVVDSVSFPWFSNDATEPRSSSESWDTLRFLPFWIYYRCLISPKMRLAVWLMIGRKSTSRKTTMLYVVSLPSVDIHLSSNGSSARKSKIARNVSGNASKSVASQSSTLCLV
jgi:hypothetical protein